MTSTTFVSHVSGDSSLRSGDSAGDSGEASLPGLQMAAFLLLCSCGLSSVCVGVEGGREEGEERQGRSSLSGICSYKGTNPITRAPSHGFHLQIPSHQELGLWCVN